MTNLTHPEPEIAPVESADAGHSPDVGLDCFSSRAWCFTLKLLKHDYETLISRLRNGDHRALARAITTVENRSPGWSELLKALFPLTGHGLMIGVTGAPGAGKSTLVDQLAKHYREENRRVGIIAVDPTSPYTGGAILGDRIRMQQRFCDPGIYIRSMATRGSLGGLARATADVATVLDAAGHDRIMIETVGVGQDEIDVVRLADVTIVILVPGMGDDVQTIKAGIMEIADIFVINKSDWEGAERVEREIRALQSLGARRDRWTPPVVKTVANEGKGLPDLVAAIAQYEAYLKQENLRLELRRQNWQERLLEMLRDTLFETLHQQLGDGTIARYAAEVAEHKRDPYTLVEEIVARFGRAT
jgi:LAO/AO transport system kinase